MEELWGPHTVDCFANFYTAKLPRFFSRFWNPGASGIEFFFVQNLESENCLVVLPVPLVARAVHYLSLQKARATIVVPFWPSSSFWPLLTSEYSHFVKGRLEMYGVEALTLGRNFNSFLGSERFTGKVVALRMDFS